MEILVIIFIILLLYGIKWKGDRRDKIEGIPRQSTAALRGIFSIVIIFSHIAVRCPQDVGFLFGMWRHLSYSAVGIFFFLSGYCLAWNFRFKLDYMKGFINRKIQEILFPYIIVSIIYWTVFNLLGRNITVKDFLFSFVNGNPIASNTWYVIAIIIYYLFFYIASKIFLRNYDKILIFNIFFVSSLIIIWYLSGYGSHWCNSNYSFVLGIGYGFYIEYIERILYRYSVWIITVSGIIFVGGFIIKIITSKYIESGLFMIILSEIISSAFTIIVFSIIYKFDIGNKITNFLGHISFQIYMLHGLFYNILLGLNIKVTAVEFTIITLFASIVVGCFFARIQSWMIKKININLI